MLYILPPKIFKFKHITRVLEQHGSLLQCYKVVTHTHTQTNTHTPIRMFRVKWRRRWLTPKSSFSRQCTGHIRDTCSQLT